MDLPTKVSIGLPSFASLDPSLVQAILAGLMVFITAVLIGFSRRYFTKSTLQGVWTGFVVGVMAILAIEGTVFWGLRSFASGEQAEFLPQNLRIALTDSQDKINQVLGIETARDRPTAQSVVSDYNLLTPLDAELAKNSICLPRLQETGQDEE